jgi:hypothetical protein
MQVVIISLICSGLLLCACSSKSSDDNFKEGKWSITTKTEIEGSTALIPARTSEHCLSAEDRIPMRHDSQSGCTLLKQRVEGDTVSWQYECAVSKGEGNVTYSGESLSGKMHMQMNALSITSTMTGEYIGPCE